MADRGLRVTHKGEQYFAFSYSGPSMAGTFREGDLLWVAPVSFDVIRRGDVIAFLAGRGSANARVVTHRVCKRVGNKLITQGDAQCHPDTAPVSRDDLLGRVCFVQREGKTRPVWGGIAGQLWAAYLPLRRHIRRLGRLPYRLLRASGLVRRLWQPRLSQICLMTEEGLVVKYVAGQCTVACWWPEKRRFWCKKPYDLVIERPDAA